MNEELRRSYTEEIVRQVGTQSALLAGFSFAGLTAVTYDQATSTSLEIAFTISTSLAMALELVALFISGILTFVSKMESLDGDKWDKPFTLAWFSYLGGLLAFVSALSLLSWVKFRPAAIPVTAISAIAAIVMFVSFYSIGKKAV
jgi:hypothetical protein